MRDVDQAVRGRWKNPVLVLVIVLFLAAPAAGTLGSEADDAPVAATEGSGGSVQQNQLPCRDPRGCPDLTVDATRLYVGTQRVESFSPTHCAVQEGLVEAGDRHLIRVTFNTPNQGEGSLEIGHPNAPENDGFFTFSSCHGHQHFDDFANYRLWTPTGYLAWDEIRRENPSWTASHAFEQHPELRDEMVAGHKQGFCMVDLLPAAPTPNGHAVPPDPLPGHNCGNQGINRGWADEYVFTLDGQWIDVTGVEPGLYLMEGETNPEHRFEESEYANNRAVVPQLVVPQ